MKKKNLFTVAVLSFVCILLSACFLSSHFPLSNENNCRLEQIEGTWIKEEKGTDGKIKRETYRIKDYKKCFAAHTDENKVIIFILTKLGSHYFISVLAKEDKILIFKLDFSENELKLLGINRDGMTLADNEIYIRKRNGDNKMKVSQRDLQKWCQKNAKYFTEEIDLFKKVK